MQENHSHHVTSVKAYVLVGLALFVLTVVTVWVAKFDFGSMNMLVAMIVATIKASLVVLIFMGLKHDNKLYAVALIISLICVALFIGLSMIDTHSRSNIYDIQMEEIKKNASMYDKK